MRVYDEYRPVFSALDGYITAFENSGYDETAVGGITTLLNGLKDTPLSDILRGQNDAVKFTLALGTLVNFSRSAAETLYRIFGVRAGSIIPEAVCEMLYGVSDIFPIVDCLSEYSVLDRFFDGTAQIYNAVMTLKPFAANFIAEGNIDDDAFLPGSDYDTHYIELSENSRAEREIAAVVRTGIINARRIIAVCGDEGSGRRTAAKRALEKLGRESVEIRTDLKYDRRRMKELASKLLLLDAVPIAVYSGNTTPESFMQFVSRLSEEVGTVIAVCGENLSDTDTDAETVIIKIGVPSIEERYRIWKNELKEYRTDDNVDPAELAGEFSFTVGEIKKALRFAEMFAIGETLTMSDIKAGCTRSASTDMGSKAVKINCVFGWDDIILPEHSKKLMKNACDQVRYRHKVYDTWGFSEKIAYGRSVSMIFTGPPGTGKTMAAQVIAAELGLDIYRVDLANVVSKYIGETEKNLDDIFEKAKKSKVVLFFDEADVLFSKRTEVKDSNDKYSNMEAAFLLQKTEEYNGIVILATNFVQNFDEAFKRRMKLLIDFPFPDSSKRAEIWRRAFPDKLPLDNIDFDYLVNSFELSGSNIKNIALYSAFLAAADGSTAVGMKHVIAALKNEYSKSGKAFTKAEAGEYFYYLED